MPNVVILAGPNGAGKTSAAPTLLRDELRVAEFVNADVIARGLSGFSAGAVAVEAGRIMLRRLDELAASRQDFAFETKSSAGGTTADYSTSRTAIAPLPTGGTFTRTPTHSVVAPSRVGAQASWMSWTTGYGSGFKNR